MEPLLLITATVLGLLAFFEPCTIATHTLHCVKIQQTRTKHCYQNLFIIWVSRSALLISLFYLSVILTSRPVWNDYLPALILSIMAILYIVSRFIYLPIPHLSVYKLVPFGDKLHDTTKHALKLGLTLPACTLPLVIIVGGMAVTLDSPGFAALAGLLFASLFTLPMLITSYKGASKNHLEILRHAASASPFITSALLLSLAVYLLIPSLEIQTDELKQVLTQASWSGIGLSFLAGFVFSFNPVSFASIPVILAYVTRAHEQQLATLMGAAFISGMILTHVSLGIAAASGGEWVQGIMGRQWGLLLGPLLILMGLLWSGWININLPWFGMKARKASGVWGAFLLGIPFTVAVCPFCTPALLVTLTASAAIGSVSFGAALLLAFALGRSIPVILGAWSMGWIESFEFLARYQKLFEIVAGITLILTGLYLLNEYFFIF